MLHALNFFTIPLLGNWRYLCHAIRPRSIPSCLIPHHEDICPCSDMGAEETEIVAWDDGRETEGEESISRGGRQIEKQV